jgi:yecA family protein
LRHAAVNPTDPDSFNGDDIRPITDPAEALEWIERRKAALAEWADEGSTIEDQPGSDPATSVWLDEAEAEWLAGFLASQQAPATNLSIEQLDGFLTALLIGPDTVLPSEYLPVIWGTEDGSGRLWGNVAQAEYVMGLLMRHWNAIAARRAGHAEHRPIMAPFGEGEGWGLGFLQGIDMHADAWAPIFKDRRADQIVLPILARSRPMPRPDAHLCRPVQPLPL